MSCVSERGKLSTIAGTLSIVEFARANETDIVLTGMDGQLSRHSFCTAWTTGFKVNDELIVEVSIHRHV